MNIYPIRILLPWKSGTPLSRSLTCLFPLLLTLVMTLLSGPEVLGQSPGSKEDSSHLNITKMPEFKGNFYGFISANTKYPEESLIRGESGKVMVKFTVTQKGKVDHISIEKSVSPALDQEAIRVVKLSSGHWIPGEVDGVPADTYYFFPLRFSIPVSYPLTHAQPDASNISLRTVYYSNHTGDSPGAPTSLDSNNHQPIFNGNLSSFLGARMTYPQKAFEDSITGKVELAFIVTKKGKVKDLRVHKSLERSLDQEAIRVMKLSSRHWTPGKIGGVSQDMPVMVPIIFRIAQAQAPEPENQAR